MAIPTARQVLQTFSHKDDLSVSDLETNGGYLVAAQADEFIAYVRDSSEFLTDIGIWPMTSIEELIERAGFTGRVSYPDTAGVAATSDERVAIIPDQQTLHAKRFKATTFLNYATLEDNLMGENLAIFVRDDLAAAVAEDQEENILLGDTSSGTAYLALYDGLIVQAQDNSGHYINETAGPEAIADDIFFAMQSELPAKFWNRFKQDLRFWVSPRCLAMYARWLSQHFETAEGYSVLNNGQKEYYFMGARIMPVPKMPDSKAMLTSRRNVRFGMWKEMRLRSQEFVDEGIWKYVLRYASDVKFIHPEGVVLYDGIAMPSLPSAA